MDSSVFAFVQGYLPDSVSDLLQEYAFRDGAPLQLFSAALAQQAARAADAVSPYTAPLTARATSSFVTMVTPVLDRIARAAYNAPDVVVLLLVVVMAVLAIQVLSLLRRLVAWWTRLLFRLLFWSGVVLVLAAVWQRGPLQSAQDAAAIAGRLYGYASFVGDIWRAEYNKYQQQQVQAQAANGGGTGGGSGAAAASAASASAHAASIAAAAAARRIYKHDPRGAAGTGRPYTRT
ncbi:hypothetical protein HMPREF1624_07603 [Sporothrix schenckii ATCC 58251]|uniref:Uncharacterized protein n=1 Tax=Sporothrix schenckii (strain ATCC 58251 / de Perez 2211183) TaxID=1391915 RepID=U7PKH6_SPOS1|nr:hypothetical protein HMPREF1624_07603 [Sporothrix schenckii ATCC 58251]